MAAVRRDSKRVKDRRRAPRVELRSEGTVDLGDCTVPCQILDVSDTGLALVAPKAAPLRAVRVRFQLGNREAAWTEIEGQVVRSADWDETGETQVWGLRFSPLDLGTRTRVRGFVAKSRRR
jgi:c-di-GMP-binding flagellar brake protein YcgR